jgi:excisionase family DNA binding protein
MALPVVQLYKDHPSLRPKSESLSGGQDVLPELFTFKEAMAYLRVSRSTLYRLMWIGELTGHKIGNTWRFYRADLQASVRATSSLKS